MYNNGKFGSDEPVAVVKLVLATTSKMCVLVCVYWGVCFILYYYYCVLSMCVCTGAWGMSMLCVSFGVECVLVLAVSRAHHSSCEER